MNTQKIILENILIYTNHGCLEEEEKIGSDYSVDVELVADLSVSAQSDNLQDTIDYVRINEIVQEQMAIRSKLLEHVAQRIMDEFKREFPQLKAVSLKISKLNPPMDGNVEKVSVVFAETF